MLRYMEQWKPLSIAKTSIALVELKRCIHNIYKYFTRFRPESQAQVAFPQSLL